MTQTGASSSCIHSAATSDMRGSLVTHGRFSFSLLTMALASADSDTLGAALAASKPYATQLGRS